MCRILYKVKNVLSNYAEVSYSLRSGLFWDTDRQVVTVVMETVQLALSQFKYFNVIN